MIVVDARGYNNLSPSHMHAQVEGTAICMLVECVLYILLTRL